MPGGGRLRREHVQQIETIGPAGWSQKTISVRPLSLRVIEVIGAVEPEGLPCRKPDPRREVSGCNRNDKNDCDRTRKPDHSPR